MRKHLKYALPLAAAAAIGIAPNTLALSSGDLMGSIIPGVPAGDADELAYVQALVDAHNAVPAGTPSVPGQTITVDAMNYSDSDPILPDAVLTDKFTPQSGETVGAGALYLLAKYGGGRNNGKSLVFYLDGVGINADLLKGESDLGLSHVSVFNGPGDTVHVPDGGATAILLGGGILGLAAFKRKRQ